MRVLLMYIAQKIEPCHYICTDCSVISETLDTQTFDNWLQIVDDDTKTARDGETFTIENNTANCYAVNPCLQLVGINGSPSRFYVERTLDSSTWTNVSIGVEIKTESFDSIGEKGLIETECDGDIQTTYFNDGLSAGATYAGCVTVSTPCDSLILRVGGLLSGKFDWVYISQITLSGVPTSSPTAGT